MKRVISQILSTVAIIGLCSASGAFAADNKTKAANKAHSEAPAAVTAGATATGTAAAGATATGESLQGLPSPEMTKFITSMKECHKGGKTDQKCHDGVMKSCEAKMTKGECAKVTTAVHSNEHKM